MLRKKFLLKDFRICFQFCKNHYSNTTSTATTISLDIQNNPLQMQSEQLNLLSKKRISASEFDFYINRLQPSGDRNLELTEKLYNLRASAEATNVHESVSQSVIKYFVDEDNIQELIKILRKRLEYGVFVDKFTGWYLLNLLLDKEDHFNAAQVATELMLQDDLDNDLIAALCIKSCYEYLLKCEGKIEQEADEKIEIDPDEPEKKVRVKFLRNVYEEDKKETEFDYLIGKTLLKSSNKGSDALKSNIKLLGLLLCEQNAVLDYLKSESRLLSKETLTVCQKFLQNKSEPPTELLDAVNTALADTKLETIKDTLDSFLKDSEKEEAKLFEIQKERQIKWQKEREQKLNEELTELKNRSRQEDVKQILAEIERNKQKLWFFSTEEKIDLQIFKKQKFYPKRWFGKKKKPRTIDENYIPPEIVRK